MKKSTSALTVLLLLSFNFLFAQTSDFINYQCIVRDAQGNIQSNREVAFRIGIVEGSSSSDPAYIEEHNATSNRFGMVQLKIGKGSVVQGLITEINWINTPTFIKIELDIEGGKNYALIGVEELASVPYSMLANDVINKDDDDADPTNELQTLTYEQGNLSISEGNTVTLYDNDSQKLSINNGVLSITGGNTVALPDSSSFNEIQTLSIDNDAISISGANSILLKDNSDTNELQKLVLEGNKLAIAKGNTVDLENICQWQSNSKGINYNKGNVGIGTSTPNSTLEVLQSSKSDTVLFCVKDRNGNPVFQVFEDGVQVIVPSSEKIGKNRASFMVSGRGATDDDQTIFLVNNDSTRIYIEDKNGFAVAARNNAKSQPENYLHVSPNSTNVTVNKDSTGGFSVMARDILLDTLQDYFNIDVDTNEIINPSESRMLWYPTKEAFLAGNVLIEDPDSVGLNSFAMGYKSKAIGKYSQAMGFENISRADYSSCLGKENIVEGSNSFAVGSENHITSFSSASIGSRNEVTGSTAIALGASNKVYGERSIAMGFNSIVKGKFSFAAGYQCRAFGDNSYTLGWRAVTYDKEEPSIYHKGAFVYADISNFNFLHAERPNQFLVRASGGTTFYSQFQLKSGVFLAPGGGAWASVGDENMLENFTAINKTAILDSIENLNIRSWNYQTQNDTIKHIGITSQNMYNTFGYGESDKTLIWMDVAGVNMVAIQALIDKVNTLKSKNDKLNTDLELLKENNKNYKELIEKQNTAIEKLIEDSKTQNKILLEKISELEKSINN